MSAYALSHLLQFLQELEHVLIAFVGAQSFKSFVPCTVYA